MKLKIEPLTRSHSRKGFSCGDESVDDFLKSKAMQDQDLRLGRTSVLVSGEGDPSRILGYHTLAAIHVSQDQIPNDRPNIRRDIPVILLGQLGVDLSIQGKGLGERLLFDAQRRSLQISEIVGIRAMALDARNVRLVDWYERYGFIRLGESLRMVKPIETIRLELE